MELIAFGKKLDATKELELFYDAKTQPFGLNVYITYNEVRETVYSDVADGEIMRHDGEVEVCHNVTEFHWLFEPNAMACESDIHGIGFGRDRNHQYKRVTVTPARYKAEDF